MPEEDSGTSREPRKRIRHLALLSPFVKAAPLEGVEVSGVRSGESLPSVQPPPTSPSPPGLTRSVYPGAVPIQLPLNLLLAPQFHERSPVLHSLSLFGKLPVGKENRGH